MATFSAQQRADLTFGLVVALLVIGWLTVLLRLWVRLRITRNPGWDDATMVLTLCLFSCYCAFILVIECRGALNHLPTPESVRKVLLYVQLGEIFYVLTTSLLKISLGLFFLRVLTKQWQIRVFHGILAVSAVYGFFYTFIAIFQCGSPARLLDNLLGEAKCLPDWFLLFTGYLYGIINVIADWTFVLIPIFILVESDMDRRSKISVSIVMSLGAVGSISSILRMVYLKGLLLNGNVNADAVKATIWATMEPGTGIVAASIAVLRPLLRIITTEVRDKISEYSVSKTSRSANRTVNDNIKIDRESMIALTSVATRESTNTDSLKNRYSIQSPTWDPTITLEEARIGKVVSVRIGQVPPKPPPK